MIHKDIIKVATTQVSVVGGPEYLELSLVEGNGTDVCASLSNVNKQHSNGIFLLFWEVCFVNTVSEGGCKVCVSYT